MATRSTSKSAGSGGRIARLQNLVRDTQTEIRKVTWPDGQTTRNLTLLVIVMATLLGILLGGIDALFVRLWEWIPS
jgi:preprotein translocase subunit SecE